MPVRKLNINGSEINAKLIPDLTALTAVEVTDTTKKSIPVADEDNVTAAAKKMLLSELSNLLTDGAGVKVYEALLTQTGTNAPTATILKNTLGEVPTFSYEDIGQYKLIITGSLFSSSKTCIYIMQRHARINYCTTISDANNIVIETFNVVDETGNNDYLINVSILIKIYP